MPQTNLPFGDGQQTTHGIWWFLGSFFFIIGLPHDSYKTQLNIYSYGPKYQL